MSMATTVFKTMMKNDSTGEVTENKKNCPTGEDTETKKNCLTGEVTTKKMIVKLPRHIHRLLTIFLH